MKEHKAVSMAPVRTSLVVLSLILALGPPTLVAAEKQANDPAKQKASESDQFKIWWMSFSIGGGKPARGMVQDPSNYPELDRSGQGTSWRSILCDLVIGITPFKVSPRIALGLTLAATVGFTSSDNGAASGTGYWPFPPVYYDITYSYSYSVVCSTISPLFVSRFAIAPRVYLNLGAGLSFWRYSHLDYIVEESWLLGSTKDHLNLDASSLEGTFGVSYAVLCQLSWRWISAEVGLIGPDVFLGIGCVI
ncbi:MAG TPA: hypothetical protein VMV03_00470 [Spirochaetia bacterium]|nr:hypothetical protein [Spirochaetia bacterium]